MKKESHPATAPDLASLSPEAQANIITATNPMIPKYIFTDNPADLPPWMQKPLSPQLAQRQEEVRTGVSGPEDITHRVISTGVHPEPLSPQKKP